MRSVLTSNYAKWKVSLWSALVNILNANALIKPPIQTSLSEKCGWLFWLRIQAWGALGAKLCFSYPGKSFSGRLSPCWGQDFARSSKLPAVKQKPNQNNNYNDRLLPVFLELYNPRPRTESSWLLFIPWLRVGIRTPGPHALKGAVILWRRWDSDTRRREDGWWQPKSTSSLSQMICKKVSGLFIPLANAEVALGSSDRVGRLYTWIALFGAPWNCFYWTVLGHSVLSLHLETV